MFLTTLSHRVSEFLGVALFALALVWLISLATYNPTDAVWFFNTGGQLPPLNFAGRIGAFFAEASYQLFGFASYLVPALLVLLGWHYFWCRVLKAAYTKLVGLILMFGCSAVFLSLTFETLSISGKTFQAGGYLGPKPRSNLRSLFKPYGVDHRCPYPIVSFYYSVDTIFFRAPFFGSWKTSDRMVRAWIKANRELMVTTEARTKNVAT